MIETLRAYRKCDKNIIKILQIDAFSVRSESIYHVDNAYFVLV